MQRARKDLRFLLLLIILIPFSSEPADHSRIDALAPVEVVAEQLREPTGVAVDQSNAIFVSDRRSGDIFKIVGSDIRLLVQDLRRPVGLGFDGQRRLLIVEESRGRLLRLETDSRLTVLAQRMKKPRWLTVAEDGTVYISAQGLRREGEGDEEGEEDGEAILRLSPLGELSIWVEGFKGLQGIVVHERTVFAAAKGLRSEREERGGIFRVPILPDGRAGAITRFIQQEIKKPFGLVIDRLGALYVSAEKIRLDGEFEEVIAKVSPAGQVTRFASNLREPRGLALDNQGNLLVADDRGGTRGRLLRFRAPPAPQVNILPFTRLSPLTVTGSTERNSRIDAFLNNSTIPIIVPTQDGSFQLTLSLLLNRQNLLDVFSTAHNGLGLTSAAAEFTIVHDNISPVISNLQPPSGSFLNNPRPLIRADFSDNLSGVDVTRVEIRLDGLNVTNQAQVSTSGFTFTPPTPLSEAQHTVSVSIFDRAGNSALATTTFTVDVTPPVISNLTPSNGSIVSTARPQIRADFSDNLSGINVASVRILLDGADVTSQASITTSGFTFTPASSLSQGSHTVSVSLSDRAGNSASASSTFTLSLGPQLGRIGDKTVNVGETLSFTVVATGPGTITLSVTPLPLPRNASFNASTGLFTFRPDLTQVGSFRLTFTATSGSQSASETITIIVPAVDPQGITALSGRILDANAFQSGQTIPVVGATVSILGSGRSAVSDANGNFTITSIPSGLQLFDINAQTARSAPDGSPYGGFREEINLIARVTNRIDRPLFLPRIARGSLATVNPNSFTTVSNPDLGVTLFVPPHTAKDANGNDFTGQLSISLVPRNLAPAALPDFLDPGLLITIQPVGVTFSQPVPITFPNIDRLTPGSQVDIWSLNAQKGIFEVVGIGLVSQDGQRIETISGGIRAADWHAALAPSGNSNTDVDENEGLVHDPTKQCLGNAGSTVALNNGCLRADISLPSYRSLGISRSVKFFYKSNRANPQPVIPFNSTIPVRAAVPPTISYKLSVAGVDQGVETFVNTSVLSDQDRGKPIRNAVSFDGSSFTTGLYPLTIRLTSNYFSSRVSSTISDRVLVVNEQRSPFGAGWGIEGLGRLNFNTNGTLVFTDGNGTAIFFSGGPNSFIPPPGDFSTLVRNLDGTFTQTLKDGTKINFNAQGLQTSAVDRNGNTTSYSYDAGGRLISITDPAGLITTLAYTGNLLNSVTDPAGRRTTFTYDAQSNLTRVTFPDGSFKSFAYDLRHLMTSETNERGFVVQREYDSAGRLVRATLPDGSIRTATNAQSVGFVDPSTGLGTITNPAPVVRPADALSRFTDGRGNQQIVKIGRFGAPLRITDALGQTTLIERRVGNDGTLLGGVTFAQGQVGQAFSFNGVDGEIVLNHAAALNFGPNDSFTIDAWLKLSAPAPTTDGVVAVSLTYVCSSELIFLDMNQVGNVFISMRDSNGIGAAVGSPRSIVDGQWHHVAGVRDFGSRSVKLYLDGVLVGSAPDTTTGTFTRQDAQDRIGAVAVPCATKRNWPGLIDEVQIFNRALTAEEIQALFNAGSRGNRATPPPGLISWWQGEGDATDSAGGQGLPTKITRPNGAVVTMSYDTKGNLLSSTDPVGANTTFTYEPNFNQVTSIRDPRGNTTTITYDVRGNPTEIRDALGNRTQMTYDTRGLLTSVTSVVGTPQQNTTSFTYDARGNLVTTTDPRGNTTTLAYDSAGNVIRSTDAEGRVTEFTYDALNRLISVLDPNIRVTRYSYDAKGNLTQVIDARTQTTTFTYDAVDRLISATNPLGLIERFVYDANGNLTSTTNRNAQTISFDYDALNRLIRKTRPPISIEVGSQVTTFSYDSVNNLTSVAGPSSIVNNAYDLANRLTSTSASSPSMPVKTISYSYDLNGNRLTMTDPQNGATTYSYDALNRLTSLTNPSVKTTSFTYDALGRRTSMNHANGVVTSYSYDAASQLTRLAHQLGAVTINSFGFTYDRVGNRTAKTSRDGAHNYSYDVLNRLIQATNPLPSNPLETYTYDPVGNRTNSNQNGASLFNQANQLTEDANFTYQYDANGNLTRKTAKVGGAFTSYEYDAENKLVRVVTPGKTVNYRYDGLGRRIEKEIIEVTTTVRRYVYDNEDILLELDGSNNILARYTHGPGIDEPLIMEKGGASFFYHADGLGSITEITDSAGLLKQQYVYSSFGKIESQLDPNFVQPYTFTGREFDPETRLYFYRNRVLDPFPGRFTSEDFIFDVNRYAYVKNNPIRLTDPLGLKEQCPDCQSSIWNVNSTLSLSGFVVVGGTGGFVSFTCRGSNRQCVGSVTCKGIGPLVGAGVEIVGAGTTVGGTSAKDLEGTSYGYISTFGPVSGSLTFGKAVTEAGTVVSGGASLGKSVGLGIAFIKCETKIYGCIGR